MAAHYTYKKPVKRSRHSTFRRYFIGIVFLLIGLAAAGFFIYSSLHKSTNSSGTSKGQTTEITGPKTTTISDTFQFQDTGAWVLDKDNTTANKLTYHKFHKNVLQNELVVYINQVPIPLYLATPRVLPVHIINSNSLKATNVSSPCVNKYAKGELHKVKEVSINGAAMLCDPDSPQYFVALSEINGDYQLKLKRPNGTLIQYVITYKNVDLSSDPTSILNIANSFHTR